MDSRDTVLLNCRELHSFVKEILEKNGFSPEDSGITADVLLAADRRGIMSHGVARLATYMRRLGNGLIAPDADMKIVKETPVSLVVDGSAGMGHPVAYRTMKKCIDKAKSGFMCLASIRNSNHYGIAGYYTQMALDENMIGISMTNSESLVVPTFGKDAFLGTNPISIGVPAADCRPFLLDMATSTVPVGKVEVYSRAEKEMPDSWATDETGRPATDAAHVLNNVKQGKKGGLLPLGGAVEETGGHKGYGLAAMVDIFCGVFSSGKTGSDVYGTPDSPPGVAHFVGAVNPEAFSSLEEIAANMDHYLGMLRNAGKGAGYDRIYVAGEKEYEAEERNRVTVPVQAKVFSTLNGLGSQWGLKLEEA